MTNVYTRPRPSSPDDDGPGFSPLNRRRFLGLGAAGLGAMALAACGGPSTSGDNGGGTTTAGGGGGGSTTGSAAPSSGGDYSGVKPAAAIKMWTNHPGGSKDVEQEIVDAYNSSQSETKVTIVTAGSTYEDVAQKFQTAQAGNDIPGIVILSDVWWFRYMINDQIIPLDNILKTADVDTGDYVDSLYNDYVYNDQHWAVPYARSTPLFYYNKAHFSKAGLPDRAPKTWDEFDEWAKKLQGANLGTQNVYNWGTITGYIGWTFQNPLWDWGGAYSKDWDITLDADPAIQALTWQQSKMKSNGGWAGITSNDQSDDFGAGAISTTISSTGSLRGILDTAKFDVGTGFLPGGPKASDKVCPTGGAGFGIPKKISPEEQVAAAKFLKFLTSPENTLKFAEATGYMPVRKSADFKALTSKTPQAQTALDQLAHTRSQDYARVFITGGDLIIAKGIGHVLLDKADPKAAMADVKSQLETIYNRDIKPNLK